MSILAFSPNTGIVDFSVEVGAGQTQVVYVYESAPEPGTWGLVAAMLVLLAVALQ